MARSAGRADLQDGASPVAALAVGFLHLVSRNPAVVGGSTAFLVALTFVSANALWYQPHVHSGAFFATRNYAGPMLPKEIPDATIRIERPPAPRPVGDPQIEEVQAILKELNFYAGVVDGLMGPNTRTAIQEYQKKMGLAATGLVDAALLDHLGASPSLAGIAPSPAPRSVATAAEQVTVTAPNPIPADRQIMKLQAGLKAFGNDDMEVDGILGARTKAAIHEFQALFGLPETGEPDTAVYAKMKEIGLTD